MVDGLDSASTPCLTDEEVAVFASGRLDESRLSGAHLHLDECEVCQRLLSEATRSLATAATVPSFQWAGAAWNTTFKAGATVGGRYLIRRFIARGGMGEVYEAFDRELHERVALKTVTSTACDNPTAVRRLKGEVQLARRVSHPNVCRIYDFGSHPMPETGAQISFLTMEFVDGESLGACLRSRGALPIPEARRLGRQLLMGLSAAHDAGVLHRDFKSDNVMLKDVNGEACPLILDFGLARAFDRDRRQPGSASNAGLVGTIAYLAPEQLEGKSHSVASDIYSLGMVWFEMLTGELPFDESPTAAVAALERMQKQAPAPSSRNPAVPADLDAIVAGCLSRLPKHRFKTTGQVLANLDELERRARPLLSRNRSWLIGAAVCGLAVSALAAWSGSTPARVVVPPNGSKPTPGTLDTGSAAPTTPTIKPVALPLEPLPDDEDDVSPAWPLRSPAGPRREPRVRQTANESARLPTAREASPRKPDPNWEDPFDAGPLPQVSARR